MTAYPLTTLAILIALLIYFGLSVVVGRARGKFNVPAPASSGHPEFEKRNRVHMNTMEQLVMFVPAAMFAAPVLGDPATATIALVWSVGRLLYARSYYADPAKRSLGFLFTILPTFILIIAAGYGAVTAL